MSKLVSSDGLNKLAKQLDKRNKNLIESEKDRAERIETELNSTIEKVEAMFDGKALKYVTQAEYDALSDAEKQSDTVVYFIIDAPETHDHDNLYYTEDEIDTKLSEMTTYVDDKETSLQASIDQVSAKVNNADNLKTISVSSTILTLTTDKRQYCAYLPSGTTIAFPSVTAFTEVHLYFATSGSISLNFPDSTKWRLDPNINTGSSYELVATYVNSTIGWMVNIMAFSL